MEGGFVMGLTKLAIFSNINFFLHLGPNGETIEFLLIVLIIAAITTLLVLILKRLFPRIALITTATFMLVAALFDLTYLLIIVAMLYILITSVFLFGNISEVRWFISNNASRKDQHKGRAFRKIYDQEAMLTQVETAARSLAKTRTGALITFELGTPLTETLKNGTPINAPVTAPLLTTIFYKGTALHDGAVVIRDNEIVAASVYYTPSTKPLAGKVGSRHRAALGISEVTDTVTLVISEETGRISVAYKGNLQRINLEDVQKVIGEHLVKG